VEESLNNVARHAAASEVEVHFCLCDQFFRIYVRDDGIGCALDILTQREEGGLAELRDRLQTWGGNLEFKSSPGQGAVVTANIPFSCPMDRREKFYEKNTCALSG